MSKLPLLQEQKFRNTKKLTLQEIYTVTKVKNLKLPPLKNPKHESPAHFQGTTRQLQIAQHHDDAQSLRPDVSSDIQHGVGNVSVEHDEELIQWLEIRNQYVDRKGMTEEEAV